MFTADQTILVTGASSGIGRAIALECIARGARVLACGRNAQRLEQARQAACAPERWTSIQRDFLTDMKDIPHWVRGLAREHGKLWGLAHAAGEGLMDCLQVYGLERARRHFDINFHVPLLLAQGFCDRRASARGGALLFVASASAVFPEKGHLLYGAAKAALAAAAKSISQEVAPRGMRVHCLSPGIVDTPMEAAAEASMGAEYRQNQLQGYPLGFGRPEDVAVMAAFLLSGQAAWITGQNFVLAGGRY
ncbi:SDR family NAD(P)-dependent oxidoreductase [uncultured Desulfovibrio sp.]|uniref:SDR family NAD(P)-dependent oxidoreductase n=2 Tax=uncultured Desulfovibrio sp. TaxID=167968 RepID=UPI002614EF5A|nr:SDR family oxidoreductase [uncultured Desulfovibrio sp.]